jgi:hypothetical protein
VRSRNWATSASRPAQIRETSDFEIPVSAPRAFTRSSTFRVETPCKYSSITTANNAWSTRRRRSSRAGKNVPARSFGIVKSRSPAVVVNTLGRVPLRWVLRSVVLSNGPAPMNAVASASINSW